jgi:cyclase
MSLAKRIIPCLDVNAGRVVKGVNFVGLRDAGDPVELAARYDREGADEVVFLDIAATHEARGTLFDVVQRTAEQLSIPLTVGGGIRGPDEMKAALNAGADKVAVNSAALADPTLVTRCSERFGAQCVVLAVDAKLAAPGRWSAFTHGGRRDTGKDVIAWCREGARLGAGEILLTSMDADGTGAGYDLLLVRAASLAVPVPVVASGGCGQARHIVEALEAGADAALVASLFHERRATVKEAKALVASAGMAVRP